MTPPKKVFVSYCWTTPEHEQWVMNLAKQLRVDGVDVAIDKWDLKVGNDKYSFMESMVKSTETDKVLIIIDKKYAEKADSREGGVGTEAQIISPEIYENVAQEKFIPVVRDKDEGGSAYVPVFLKGRIYIDMSSDDAFDENYKALLKTIHNIPLYDKPEIGNSPSYLFENAISHTKTNSIVRGFDNRIAKNPKLVNSILQEFFDEFYNSLKDYSIDFQSRGTDYEESKAIYDKINEMRPLRDDFIAFIEKLLRSEIDFDTIGIIAFLEKLPFYEYPHDKSQYYSYDCDNYKFFIRELFLYLIVIGLRTEKYEFIGDLLYASYFVQNEYDTNKEVQPFVRFNDTIESINQYYKERFSSNSIDPLADIIVDIIPDGYTKDMIAVADLLCHYVAKMDGRLWFPVTYHHRASEKIELFEKLVSRRHFEKVKYLFGVDTVDELQNKLEKFNEKDKDREPIRYRYSIKYVRPLSSLINIDTIGTVR